MAEPLILIDLDETLIGVDHDLTVPSDAITGAIRRAEARGAIVGLNSDSGISTLERYAHELGIHGPIIAERGALVQRARGDVRTPIVPDALRFYELRNLLLSALMSGQRTRRYVVILGDVNALSMSLPPISPHVLPADIAVLVNGIRTCSLAFYVRKRIGDEWVKDEAALDEVIGVLEESAADDLDPALWAARDVDRNPAYGICIIHHRDTQKSRAVDWILEHAGDRPVSMIGNSMSDDLRDSRVVQCAVGNAKPEYKARAIATGGLVAEHDLTEGVIELLDRITTT